MNHSSTSSVSETLLVQGEDTIVQISSPKTPKRQANLPCLDLVNGSREDYLKYAIPLYQASLVGNWEAATVILKEKPELVRFAITETYETMLHIATSAKSTKSVEYFVENLIMLLEKEDLELQNKDGYTALALAASVGNLTTSMMMLSRNSILAEVPVDYGMTPLYMAAAYARHIMTRVLYDISHGMSSDFWTPENRGSVLQKCVEAGFFDVALKILHRDKELISERRLLGDILLALAQNPHQLRGFKQHIIWRLIKSAADMNHSSTSSVSETLLVQGEDTIVQISSPKTPKRQANLPCLDLVNGSREDYLKYAIPLYQASLVGNWEAATVILKEKPELVRFAITETYETMLHIAASAKSTKSVEYFVENLIMLLEKEDLELQNKYGYIALALAASVGNLTTSMMMLSRNSILAEVPVDYGMMPLYMAAAYARHIMTTVLCDISHGMSSDFWTPENRGSVLQKCVEAGFFDVALKILHRDKELISERRLLGDILLALAQNPHQLRGFKQHIIWRLIKSVVNVKVAPAEKQSSALRILKIVWQQVAIMPKGEIDEIIRGPLSDQTNVTQYPSQLPFLAVKSGNTRFIIELIRSYPDLVLKLNDKGRTIFHEAVKHRNEEIYNLLYEIGSLKDQIVRIKDKKGNNMLHLAARCSSKKRIRNATGPALNMQRELLWYMNVEMMVPANYQQERNTDGYSPIELFPIKHAELLTRGEEWMKHTASQCMVVSTLIATMVFGAAFALPGGYDQDTGIPFFSHKPPLIVFVISDAVSLLTSSTSILIFLSILTSSYAEIDFLKSLPRKLMLGLTTLFFSIVTMMIAFSASFFVLYKKNLQWMPIIVTSLAGIPVILYAILQIRLLGHVFYSTYQSRYLFEPKKAMLY